MKRFAQQLTVGGLALSVATALAWILTPVVTALMWALCAGAALMYLVGAHQAAARLAQGAASCLVVLLLVGWLQHHAPHQIPSAIEAGGVEVQLDLSTAVVVGVGACAFVFASVVVTLLLLGVGHILARMPPRPPPRPRQSRRASTLNPHQAPAQIESQTHSDSDELGLLPGEPYQP